MGETVGCFVLCSLPVATQDGFTLLNMGIHNTLVADVEARENKSRNYEAQDNRTTRQMYGDSPGQVENHQPL